MATEYSFDIVSKINRAEMDNALNQARKEVTTRFDFKGGNPVIDVREKGIYLEAGNKMMLQNLREIVEARLSRRSVSLKFFEFGKEEDASKGAFKQFLTFREGIGKEEARRLIDLIKKSDIKVKTQIQEEQLRVTSRVKDELQKVIQLAKDNEREIPLQFVNYR